MTHLSVYLLEIEKAPKLVALKKEQPALFAGRRRDGGPLAGGGRAAGRQRASRATSSRTGRGRDSRAATTSSTGRSSPSSASASRRTRSTGRDAIGEYGMMTEYLRRTREGDLAVATSEETDEEDSLRRKEGLMLGLRLSGGVPSSSFEEIRKTLPAASASAAWRTPSSPDYSKNDLRPRPPHAHGRAPLERGLLAPRLRRRSGRQAAGFLPEEEERRDAEGHDDEAGDRVGGLVDREGDRDVEPSRRRRGRARCGPRTTAARGPGSSARASSARRSSRCRR